MIILSTMILAMTVSLTASPAPPKSRLISIGTAATYTAPTCPGANRAIGFYRRSVKDTLERIGDYTLPARKWWGCHSAQRRAVEWRTRARRARDHLHAWLSSQYAWQRWLPDKYARVGACETGYGRRPGNWQHDSGTYVSAFGIIRSAYDQFSARLGYTGWDEGGRTPRQQYEVAAAIQARYGWSAWGCGAA